MRAAILLALAGIACWSPAQAACGWASSCDAPGACTRVLICGRDHRVASPPGHFAVPSSDPAIRSDCSREYGNQSDQRRWQTGCG